MRSFNRVNTLLGAALVMSMVAVAITTVANNRGDTHRAPITAHAAYLTDLRDDRRLVGMVDNVFVGRVTERLGTKILDGLPETQYQVEVLENIKGTLKGKVIVNQEGGMDGEQLVLFDDDPLLKPGQTYLFTTLPYTEMGWHTLVPRYGDLLIADEKQYAIVVERFQKATKEQIPYMP